MKTKKSKIVSEPTITDIIVLGKFSDGKVRQVLSKDIAMEAILSVIQLTSDRNIISVLDKELPLEFEQLNQTKHGTSHQQKRILSKR